MVAADKGNIKIVKMLIDHGAAVALRSKVRDFASCSVTIYIIIM